MNREIKFRVIYKGKIHGFEKLTNLGWFWDCIDLDPDNGQERWVRGVFPYGFEYLRNQYTGEKDKNGVEVYENDIIRYDLREGLGEPEIRGLIRQVKYSPRGFFGHYDINIVVIGNIYQHPELLKK